MSSVTPNTNKRSNLSFRIPSFDENNRIQALVGLVPLPPPEKRAQNKNNSDEIEKE